MKTILILGGTQMLGRDFVETLLLDREKYDITLANRGITNKNLFPDLKKLKIDRDSEESYNPLEHVNFDLIIDFSCYRKEQLIQTLKHAKYQKYILISTQSVFDTQLISSNNYTNEYWKYCYNKKEIEDYVYDNKIFTITIVRPCAVYGDNDYTNRFEKKENIYYWRHNGARASDTKGCISVQSVTEILIGLVKKEQIEEEKISFYNIG